MVFPSRRNAHFRILGYLRAIVDHLGSIFGHLGAISGHLGAILGHLWAILCHLGAILCHLGGILGHLGASLRQLGVLVGGAWALKVVFSSRRNLHICTLERITTILSYLGAFLG